MSSLALPCAAFSPIRAHHGYGQPNILATLSKHSPAASSSVDHSLVSNRFPREVCAEGGKLQAQGFFIVSWIATSSLCSS
jgi:hypothetical protein